MQSHLFFTLFLRDAARGAFILTLVCVLCPQVRDVRRRQAVELVDNVFKVRPCYHQLVTVRQLDSTPR